MRQFAHNQAKAEYIRNQCGLPMPTPGWRSLPEKAPNGRVVLCADADQAETPQQFRFDTPRLPAGVAQESGLLVASIVHGVAPGDSAQPAAQAADSGSTDTIG